MEGWETGTTLGKMDGWMDGWEGKNQQDVTE